MGRKGDSVPSPSSAAKTGNKPPLVSDRRTLPVVTTCSRTGRSGAIQQQLDESKRISSRGYGTGEKANMSLSASVKLSSNVTTATDGTNPSEWRLLPHQHWKIANVSTTALFHKDIIPLILQCVNNTNNCDDPFYVKWKLTQDKHGISRITVVSSFRDVKKHLNIQSMQEYWKF
jgi:hypothetical protein